MDEIEGGIPRVSPYRLAAHLTCAFALFSTLLYTGLGVLQPRAAAAAAPLRAVHTRGAPPSGSNTTRPALAPRRSRGLAPMSVGTVRLLATLVGVTAISGAFVAGMQA